MAKHYYTVWSVEFEDIITRAKELGGSKNPKVKEPCERLIGTINPNKSEDGEALTKLLEELKNVELEEVK